MYSISSYANSHTGQPFFPDREIPFDIIKFILEMVAEDFTVYQWTQLAFVSRAWKKVTTSKEMFAFLFKRHFSEYLHYAKRPNQPGANDFITWYLNLYGTKLNKSVCTRSQPRQNIRWDRAQTDGYQFVVYTNKTARTIRILDLTQLKASSLVINCSRGNALIRDINVLETRIGVLLSTNKMVLYDVSVKPPSSIEFDLPSDIERIALTKDGFFYRSSRGQLFHQKTDKSPVRQLSTSAFTMSERINSRDKPIPLITSKGGYYLFIEREMDNEKQRHYWKLGHLDSGAIDVLAFTTDSNWMLAMDDKSLAAYNHTNGKMYYYKLALSPEKIWAQHGELPMPRAIALGKKISIKIWGTFVVISNENGELTRIQFQQGQPGRRVNTRLFERGLYKIFGPPFINPNGLNFVVRPTPVTNPSDFQKAEIFSVSFSSFPSLLSQPFDIKRKADPTRRSERIKKRKLSQDSQL